jgi:hypothetical protein
MSTVNLCQFNGAGINTRRGAIEYCCARRLSRFYGLVLPMERVTHEPIGKTT